MCLFNSFIRFSSIPSAEAREESSYFKSIEVVFSNSFCFDIFILPNSTKYLQASR